MTAAMLDEGRVFGRYLDVDGDGIPFRTYPGTHPTKGAYFTRGTSKNPYAVYSEAGADYQYNMERLNDKHAQARHIVPQPEIRIMDPQASNAVLYFGSTAPAMDEALEAMNLAGHVLNACRIRAFPFSDDIAAFVAHHQRVFVIEQNRDAQIKSLLVNEAGISPERLQAILHYDGTPITARFIKAAMLHAMQADLQIDEPSRAPKDKAASDKAATDKEVTDKAAREQAA
jgi:2-oxoglutarate ferredoxin oxidoreductase subunit alpha